LPRHQAGHFLYQVHHRIAFAIECQLFFIFNIMKDKRSRRTFLKSSALAGFASAIGTKAALANDAVSEHDETKRLVILFQGDSITDGNRGRNNDPNHIMGHGYAFSVAGRVGADFASSNHSFFNRGISGNKLTDLEKRWQTDTLDLKPDVVSVLIGINDAAGLVAKPTVEEADIDLFETTYRNILTQSKQQNPGTLFVLCLPFVYPGSRTKDNLDNYRDIVAGLTGRTKKLASEFNAVVVDFTAVFDKAIKKAPIEYWIWDGIHPTVPGHELMAREWIKQVSSRLRFLRFYKY
jgi:lysophospholipase L1-like esterase